VNKMERTQSKSYHEKGQWEQLSKLKADFFREIDHVESLANLDPQKINEFADNIAKIIHADIATSQLRKVYGEMKRLQKSAKFEAKKLSVFAPRLAYASARTHQLQHVYELFEKCRPKISNEKDMEKFIYILEALVAYHKYYYEKYGRRES